MDRTLPKFLNLSDENDFFRLTCLDLMCLKKLNRKANLVPVISMADALTQAELEEFRVSFSSTILYGFIKTFFSFKVTRDERAGQRERGSIQFLTAGRVLKVSQTKAALCRRQ